MLLIRERKRKSENLSQKCGSQEEKMCNTVLRFNLHSMNELQQMHGIRYATAEATVNSVGIL
jgi:hypothetical protein